LPVDRLLEHIDHFAKVAHHPAVGALTEYLLKDGCEVNCRTAV